MSCSKIEIEQPAANHLLRDTFIACSFSAILTLVATREGRQLTFDGYYYVELAKCIARQWPDRFGNHWPFGWPIAGSLLVRLGIPAYFALAVLSAAALVVVIAATGAAFGPTEGRLLAMVAVGAAPVIAPQLSGCLTELPFAAVLMGMVVLLARWPRRPAIWGSAALCVLGFTIRYSGLFSLGVLAVWCLVWWRPLGTVGRRAETVLAWASAAAVCFLLISINIRKSGYASGAARGVSHGFATAPSEMASLGLSAPSALIAGGIRDRVGPGSLMGLAAGGLAFAAMIALCVRAWIHPASSWSRPTSLVTAAYCFAMVYLHTVGNFDALYNARTFLPVLAPIVLLFSEQVRPLRPLLGLALGGLIASGMIAAARGISREIAGDVRPVVPALRARVTSGDRVAINDQALSLSAFLYQPVDRTSVEGFVKNPLERFLVIAAKPVDRQGTRAPEFDLGDQPVSTLLGSHDYRVLVNEPGIVALEKMNP